MEQMLPDRQGSLDKAEMLNLQGHHEEAAQICRRLLQQESGNLEALFLLATISYAAGAWDEAAALYRQACDSAPEIGFLRINLALALQELGRFEEALAAFEEAELLGEATVNLYYNRGVLLQRLKQLDTARHAFEQALAIDPGHINSWINLSAVCLASDDYAGALHCCGHGLHGDPCNVALIANLATVYGKLFRFEESLAWYMRMLELVKAEERAELLGRIANCLSDLWMIDDAIACFDLAVKSSGDAFQKRALASTRLFVLHYSTKWSASAIAAEHRAWGQQYFKPAPARNFTNSRNPDRPIRVGYLSPDLKIHAVVFFLQPVLAAHNPDQVTVYCYSDVQKPDAVTYQIKESHNVIWRDSSCLDDAALQELIMQDQIDILVDLAGHTALNRLPLFAGRAAPVQVSWIGYPSSTGLTEMDYRITDAWADPPGMTEHLHTEQLLRMPDSFLCYRPGGDFPEPGEPPCLSSGLITFGSFSNFKKVTPATLELWASILAAVSGSRLVFRARGMIADRFNREIAPIFASQGVDPQRITVLGHARSVVENLSDYRKIDIALDTFPYHGTTTTCESLCMGVPVVTLEGDAHVSRVGISLLNTVGLHGFIAKTENEYRTLAVGLANDSALLHALRYNLRERLLDSPLTDNVTFTCHLEQLYRQIWHRWCKENNKR